MTLDIDSMDVLDRRRIEAMVLAPLIRAFQDEFGCERATAVARRTIEDIARAQGRALRDRVGDGDLEAFAGSKGAWQAGGALETTVHVSAADCYEFDVTRCRYAEMYRNLGCADLGFILSCGRDAAFIEGFNPDVALTRTQTIMQGAPTCDFRYRLQAGRSGKEPLER
jgi:hypothetical protein